MSGAKISVEELAVKMDNFYYDYDYYNYVDSYESREEGVKAAYNMLVDKSYSHVLDELSDIIEYEEGTEDDIKAAKELLELLQQLD